MLQIMQEVSERHIITELGLIFYRPVSLLPLFDGEAVEVCNRETKHFQTDQKVLNLLRPCFYLVFIVSIAIGHSFTTAAEEVGCRGKEGYCNALPESHKYDAVRFERSVRNDGVDLSDDASLVLLIDDTYPFMHRNFGNGRHLQSGCVKPNE